MPDDNAMRSSMEEINCNSRIMDHIKPFVQGGNRTFSDIPNFKKIWQPTAFFEKIVQSYNMYVICKAKIRGRDLNV